MKHRFAPRRAGGGAGPIGRLVAGLQPASVLADVQRVWPDVVGDGLARHATPTSAQDGVVHVTCQSAGWAQELTLMGAEVAGLLNARIGAGTIRELRCSAAPARAWLRP